MKRPLACAGFLYLRYNCLQPSPQALGRWRQFLLYKPGMEMGRQASAPSRAGLFRCGCGAAAAHGGACGTVAPAVARAGTQAEIHAAVVETSPGFVEDTVRASARWTRWTARLYARSGYPSRFCPKLCRVNAFGARAVCGAGGKRIYIRKLRGRCFSCRGISGWLFFEGRSGALWARAKRIQALLSAGMSP